MKAYTNIKVGYSAGVYGCTGEYFSLLIIHSNGEYDTVHYHGLYGSEYRVVEPLKAKGYKPLYLQSNYGRLTGEDKKPFIHETTALNKVKEFMKGKHGKTN